MDHPVWRAVAARLDGADAHGGVLKANAENSPGRFVITALFDPIDVGTEFARKRWPAHVTLVSNFVTGSTVGEIAEATRRAISLDAPLVVEIGDLDHFGPDRIIPVRLVEAETVAALHSALVDALEATIEVDPDEKSYWRAGYRPHVTLGRTVDVRPREQHGVDQIALVRLDRDTATVSASLNSIE